MEFDLSAIIHFEQIRKPSQMEQYPFQNVLTHILYMAQLCSFTVDLYKLTTKSPASLASFGVWIVNLFIPTEAQQYNPHELHRPITGREHTDIFPISILFFNLPVFTHNVGKMRVWGGDL